MEVTTVSPRFVASELQSPIQPSSHQPPCNETIDVAAVAEKPAKPHWRCEVEIFASTFLTIFLAELGDKTQLTTLLMSAESHAPWVVFAGAGSALVATSLFGILIGRWLSQRVSPRTLELASAALLLLVAGLLIWDVVQG